ncbi:zinc-dependent metalloprotease [uncultured Winogradskyella sp.]|uniref:zinc-dependent metalloprotease n=1 Tax=uncultured Winogradskyella sp. TaxID=395353 RepID=UPI00260606B4|nr:zinc-dependent metalloprotease [uncultured Winogradskyella sp.]
MKFLRLPLLFIFVCLSYSNIQAQVSTKYSENLIDYQEVKIDIDRLKSNLQNARIKGTAAQNKNSNTIVELPIPKGGMQQFRVVESPILSPELSAARPEVKSYIAKGIDDPTATTRFNITSAGFYGVIKSVDGISIIEKMDRTSRDNQYITYYDHNIIQHAGEFECQSEEESESRSYTPTYGRIDSCFQIGDNLRSYEMVLTCSGEFYALNGGTDPLVEAALLNRITQVNTVYETEVATTFSIVEFLLNSDPATDPYSDPTNTFSSITETENYINANVSVSSWDIGHGFHEITCGSGCGWAGRAGLGVVCTTAKARGYTYLPNDIPTAITVLLHEFGHQFSNRHTNYGCNSNNACSRYEPGQGSTIMSTGAGCDAGDDFANRTDYFSVASLQSMINFMDAGLFVTGTSCGSVTIGGWSDCSTLIPTGNNMPSSDANVNSINGLVIPHSTPFLLTGSGSDPDGVSSLTYNWEQYDTDYAGSDAPDDTATSTTAPLFRSFPPSTSNERTVPILSSVLAGNITTGTGEVLPSVARNLTWRLTVRDNEIGGGGVACDQISLTVGADGPFRISSQNSTTAWMAGDTETVTWDVANTDNAIYTCANVDVLYSSDGGNTFSTTLASGVPNNGSVNITVPGLSTTTGRIKIVCTGGSNIFFDINDVDILVTSSCNAVVSTITNSNAVTETEGDSSLNLNLMAGVPVNSVSGVLDASDGNTNLTVENNGTDTCIPLGLTPKFETIELASASNSNVTFTRTQQADYFSMIGLFEGSYNTGSVCDNWLNSNGNYDGGSIVSFSSSFVEPLAIGTKYVLLTSGFYSTTPPVGNYDINFSETLYNVGALNVTGYLYTYVIVNNTSGNIIAFDEDSDLSNQSNFPSGNYSVYGLSYLAGEPIASYIGGAFSNFQSDLVSTAFCGALSSNSVLVNILPGTPTTYTYNNSWSPSNPEGVSSASDNIVVEAGIANISINTNCNNLTVNPGAALTIDAGVTITATVIELNSTSQLFSSLISDGSIVGTVNYNRFVSQVGPIGTNDLISAPISGQLFPAFSTLNLNLPASGSIRAFAPYNTASGAYQNYDIVANLLTTINPGIGYRTATTDGSTLTFTGNIITSDVLDVPITDAAAGSAWNLIGNPYPSYIDFETFFNLNSSEFATGTAFQAIYGYDGSASNGWTVWNLATIADGSVTELIAPGQGFFVKSKTGGGLVDFTTSMRRTGSSDDFIMGRNPINNVALCKLNLSSLTNNSSTQIYFIEGTTRGLDVGYDAGNYTASTTDFLIYSNLVEENSGLDMAIQSLPYDDFNNVVIPLGINAESGVVLTITIDDISTLPSDINVYLEDNVTNTWTLLNDGDYTFSPSVDLSGTGRFYIHYSSVTLSTENIHWDNLQIYNTTSPKEIIVKGQLSEDTEASLYDNRGRLILKKKLELSSIRNTIDVSSLGTGVYIVKVFSDSQTKTQKLVIK